MVHTTAEVVQQPLDEMVVVGLEIVQFDYDTCHQLHTLDHASGCLSAASKRQHDNRVYIGSHRNKSTLNDPITELERDVSEHPNDAKRLIALANAYWLSGRGPEVAGELASRAIAIDPENRAGWHLWALAESDPRQRLGRWQQVSARFSQDDLAKANVADNAAAVAGAEHDHEALDLAIATYEQLLATATQPDQREALTAALRSLRGWKL